MKGKLLCALCVLCLPAGLPAWAAQPTAQVFTYHADRRRSGNFVIPALTWRRASAIQPDKRFHVRIDGHVYAQPLYWSARDGRAMLLVATENDTVYALDALSGKTLWRRVLGRPVPLQSLPCGDIDPLGITGTPVIDPEHRAIYLDALVRSASSGAPTHEIFGLSLEDGAVLAGWPIDVGATLARRGLRFSARVQGERGALTVLHDSLYVSYGGRYGDCGRYHGWVIAVKLDPPKLIGTWHTPALAGGIWAPAGVSSDGRSLYVATGNTMQAGSWGGGEAVIRLTPLAHFTGARADFFAPRNWRTLDERDADLGGVAPLLFDVGGARYVLALGKDGNAYLLNRHDLGGFGGALAIEHVADSPIRAASAQFAVPGGAMIAFQGTGSACPTAVHGDLTVLKVTAASPPRITTAWCAAVRGSGAPIVTTTDGRHDPIVWMLGAKGDQRLYGFRGDTGQRLFVSAPLPGLRRFQTLIATSHRLYVAADDAVYAFSF